MTGVADVETVIDPKKFREVLGQYPTGVSVIAAMLPTGPIGMVVGSFTSVSLDPPLVAFFPDRQSGTWAALSQAPQFCVSILSAEQEPECRKLASRDPGKFSGLDRQVSPNGSPIVEGAVAWIDCDRHSVTEAGDHFIVLGRVSKLEIGDGGLPLLFFQGGYGRFAPASLVTSDTEGLLTEQLRIVDLARSEIESLAAHVGGQCVATTRVGNQLIVAASAGQSHDGTQGVPVGQRLPFAPPFGAIFAAWDRDDHIARWIGSQVDGAQSEVYRAALATVRARGFAVALPQDAVLQTSAARQEDWLGMSAAHPPALEKILRSLEFDPSGISAEIDETMRMASAPIFDGSGRVVLALTIQGFPISPDGARMRDYVATLLAGAERLTQRLNGRRP